MEELKKLIRRIGEMKRQQVIITGDFNLKSIDWTTGDSRNQVEKEFINACTDAFLIQHVREPTRGRSGQEPSLLDLILTTADDNINNLQYLSPIGASDHACLVFDYHCPMEHELNQRTITLYNKGNYQAMNAELHNVQWANMIDRQDTAASYEKFADTINMVGRKHIPRKTFAAGERRKTPGIASDVAKLIKKKKSSLDKIYGNEVSDKIQRIQES